MTGLSLSAAVAGGLAGARVASHRLGDESAGGGTGAPEALRARIAKRNLIIKHSVPTSPDPQALGKLPSQERARNPAAILRFTVRRPRPMQATLTPAS